MPRGVELEIMAPNLGLAGYTPKRIESRDLNRALWSRV